MKKITKDLLSVEIYDTRAEMGKAAGALAAKRIKEILAVKEEANVIFAAAPSQNEMLAALIEADGIDWGRVNAFHMDEYIGLSADAPQGFGNFLKDAIFGKLPFKSVNYINCEAKDVDAECARYTALLKANPVDVVLLGIGENGHIAFNDPPADFDTKEAYIIVNLDDRCKKQQMGEGWFATIDDVPKQAVSMTTYQIMQCKRIVSCVPHAVKAEAIKNTVKATEVTNMVPATLLKTHPDFILYVDENSAAGIMA